MKVMAFGQGFTGSCARQRVQLRFRVSRFGFRVRSAFNPKLETRNSKQKGPTRWRSQLRTTRWRSPLLRLARARRYSHSLALVATPL